jgi:asparagine synthase (glutamine-hydrolysing)
VCGIAGIFAYRNAPVVAAEELCAIRDELAARGPDGAGAWLSDDRRIGLGHRRLSIIDLSERGRQPMASEDGSLVLVFNGEIYNHRALRESLEARGRSFRSSSDTEVLLELYAEKGVAMFADLRGMYAFALWDARRKALLVARDPYGIKPLYLADDGHTLRFASQVKALLAGRVARTADPGGVAGFYLFGSVPEPRTRYRFIRALTAGHYQWFDQHGAQPPVEHHSIARVFQRAAASPTALGDPRDLERAIADALTDSVKHHLVADVAVGAFLSSGVDSSALVALMSEAGQRELRTITLAFDDLAGGDHDETRYADMIAARYGTNHSTTRVAASDLVLARDKIFAAMDQPSIDGINTWLVSRAAHEAGLKVCVSGLGGDELFGGYPSFRSIPRWVRALRFPSRVPRLGQSVEWLFRRARLTRLPVSPKLGSVLRYGGSYAGAYLLRRGLFLPAELPLVMGAMAEQGLAELDPVAHVDGLLDPDPGEGYARVAVLEATMYLRNQLLRDSDWASMAHGLEIRVPFVDAELLARLAPLLVGSSGRIRPKELIARAPRRQLPRELVVRKKSGFFVPVEPLLRDRKAGLDGYKRVPELAHPACHWSRRLAYVLQHDGIV